MKTTLATTPQVGWQWHRATSKELVNTVQFKPPASNLCTELENKVKTSILCFSKSSWRKATTCIWTPVRSKRKYYFYEEIMCLFVRMLSVIKGLLFKLDSNLNSKFDTLKLLHGEDFKGTAWVQSQAIGNCLRGDWDCVQCTPERVKTSKTDSNNHLTRHSNLKVGW